MREKNRCIAAGRWIVLACLGVLLGACHPAPASHDSQAKAETEKKTMNLAQPVETDARTIPPIDADSPDRFETAAFGMG